MDNMDKYYYAELSENMRMKLFVIQHKLSDENMQLSASDTLELCIDALFEEFNK